MTEVFYSGMKRERDEDKGTIVRRFGTATTKRRAFGTAGAVTQHQLDRVYKKLKISAPLHMYNPIAGTDFPSDLSTTITAYDIHSGIAQGDTYNSRFGTVTRTYRLVMKGVLQSGTGSTSPTSCRISVVQGQVGSTGAQLIPNFNVSANPIANNRVTRLYSDRHIPIPAFTSNGWSCPFNLNLKLKHRMNYTGSAAATQTGETVFVVMQSNVATGVNAPVWNSLTMEIWFQP